MKLEHQVTSLEISKRLKELGVKQESLFFYAKSPDNKFRLYPLFFSPELSATVKLNSKEKDYSAFTVAELGEMLPAKIYSDGFLEIYKTGKKWKVMYVYQPINVTCFMGENFISNTEADARGKCLIYLLENKLITL